MNAFDEAIDRIDDINAPEKIKPTMIKTFEYFSKYFEEHKDININFYKLFEESLYSNSRIKGPRNLKVELVDNFETSNGIDPAGTYSPRTNTLKLFDEEQYNESDVSTFMHEFVHFIMHSSYVQDIPDWADEMMTEYSTRKIGNFLYGGYWSLVKFADFINDNIEPINIDQFFNGEFKNFIKKYNLEIFNEELDEIRQEKNSKSNLTTLACYFINLKSKEIFKENLNFEEYLNEIGKMANLDICFDGIKIENEINNIVLDYLKYKYRVNLKNKKQEIQGYVKAYYIQKRFELKSGCKIAGFDEINFNGIISYIVYAENGEKFVLFNSNGYDGCMEKFNGTLSFNKNDIGWGCSTYYDINNAVAICDCREGKDEKIVLKFNETTKRFDIPENCDCKHFICTDNAILKKLKNKLELINYQNKCKSFDSKQMRRIESFDLSMERRLKEINQIAKLLGAEIYCTPPSKWTSGENPETSMIVHSPMYYLKNIEEKDLKKVSFLDIDSIQTLLETIEWGSQVNFVIKDEKGKLLPLANVIKNYKEGEFSLHTNYNAFMDKLPNAQKENIYKKYVPKEELFKGEN